MTGWKWAAVLSCCFAIACSESEASTPSGSRAGEGASSREPHDAGAIGEEPLPTNDDPTAVFVAFAADFKGFRSWPHYDVTPEPDEDAGPQHPEEQLIEYINRRPPHAAAAFPFRTIIVKEATTPPALNYFAMVKRGGDFNMDGARNWEWFELQDTADGGVLIVWRGVGPPFNEEYGGDPDAGCNKCHTPDLNDSVLAPALDLRGF